MCLFQDKFVSWHIANILMNFNKKETIEDLDI